MLWILWLLACDDTIFGAGESGTEPTVDPDAQGWCAVQPILASCTSCHSAAAATGGLDLETNPHGALVDVTSAAYGVPLVTPGDADGSLLVQKLEDTQTFGGPMPPTGTLLSADLIAKVRAWVDDGADDVCDGPTTQPTTLPTGYHPAGWDAPDVHGMAAKFQTEADCRSCHGPELQGDLGPACESCHGAGWETTCTFCHGGVDSSTGAPPENIDDTTDDADSPYVPHTTHLADGDHAAIACDTCHQVPTSALAPGHLFDDTTAGQAEVQFSGLAAGGSWNGSSCTVYCHGTGTQQGTITHTDGPRVCSSCHADQTTPGRWSTMSGQHTKHLDEGIQCAECHGQTVNPAGQIVGADRHVNGQADIDLPLTYNGTTCTGACHGEGHNGRRW